MSNLGALLSNAQLAYARGDLANADRFLADALLTSPNHLEATVLQGIVSARKGNRKQAISLLKNAIAIDKRCYEAHVALSTLLFADGNAEEAIEHGERAIALAPNDPESYLHLSRDLIAHSRTADAIPYLRRALKLAPNHPVLIQNLAAALTEVGQLRESLEQWKALTRQHPRILTGWLKLGGMYLAADNSREAVACGRRAILLDPDSADARILMGLALLGSDGSKESLSHLKHALTLRPNEMVAHSAYGLALHEMGEFEEARPYFEKTLELCPTNGQAYYSLIRTRKSTEKDRPLLEKAVHHLEHPGASLLDRSYMNYALGKANEDLGDYESSMRYFEEATRLAAEAWFSKRVADRNWYSGMIQATIETFTPKLLRFTDRKSLSSEKPLLVVGMMRSGTTLVEQILSSHPKVKGAGELSYWHDEAAKIFNFKDRKIDESGLKLMAQGYLDLLERLGPGYERVTDKLPHNYTMIGFILAAIPNARVIYVKRHPVDNCLSIFTTAYQHPPSFTLTRSNIMFGYREHERIMAHWKRVLSSEQLLEVQYEDIVQDREVVTRRMIEFAGLEWDDSCLYHEKNERSVNTPSFWQVRQPIYSSSVARWRKFEPWLGEFKDLLSPDDQPSASS